jgi:hypothetical protein
MYRQGALAFLFPEPGYEAYRDPNQSGAVHMYFRFRVLANRKKVSVKSLEVLYA